MTILAAATAYTAASFAVGVAIGRHLRKQTR